MLRYLLDTDVVSEVLRLRPDPRVLDRLRACRGEAALPSVAWHELVELTGRMPAGPGRRRYAAFLREVVSPSLPVVAYDRDAATWHARLAGPAGGESGAAMSDAMVAAVAAVHGLILVTRRPAAFAGFPGITLERWHG